MASTTAPTSSAMSLGLQACHGGLPPPQSGSARDDDHYAGGDVDFSECHLSDDASPPPPYLTPPNESAFAAASSVASASAAAAAAATTTAAANSLSRCAVCQDVASGVHYGVPACEGCKGFFRRIVSSRNIGGACSHAVPLEMMPQTRNTCQWCRLKKCCAVNMGRQRSKLGRRAKNRSVGGSQHQQHQNQHQQLSQDSPTDQIMLPGYRVDAAASTGGDMSPPPAAASAAADYDAVAAAGSSPSDISDQQLLAYIEQKRHEFETQVSRRSCFRKEQKPATGQQQLQHPPSATSPPASSSTGGGLHCCSPSLLQGRLSGMRVTSQLLPSSSCSSAASPPEPQYYQHHKFQQQAQQQQQQHHYAASANSSPTGSAKCLRLISRRDLPSTSPTSAAAASANKFAASSPGSATADAHDSVSGGAGSSISSGSSSSGGGGARAPKKVWLEKSCLLATPLVLICRRLAGPQRAAELEHLHNSLTFNNMVSHLILTAVDKFVNYWEADLNAGFVGNPRCGRVIAENTRLILEGHRLTFYFTQERMRRLRDERLPQLYEPGSHEEGAVVGTLVGYIPQLMLRIVAFTRNIFGSTSSQHQQQQQQQGPPASSSSNSSQLFHTDRDSVSVSCCSDVVTDADKKKLIVHHCFKLVAMRFCASLVQSSDDYIIDPTMQYRLTRSFLQSAKHPMLSQLFVKFFDVSRKWDSLRIDEKELAFLSAICLTSPYIGIQYPESIFDDLNAVVSVHSAVIGLFWIYLRSEEIAMRGWTVEMVASDARLNLTVRLAAVKRLLELSTVFTTLLSVDGMHKENGTMIESIIERLNASSLSGTSVDGFPDFNAPYNPVGQSPPNPITLRHYGAGVYQEVFRSDDDQP